MKLKKLSTQICTLCFVCISVFLGGCGEENLYSNRTEREANEMMTLLQRGQIEVKKEAQADGLFSLKVAESDLETAIAVIQNHGLPRESRKNCEEMFEKSGSLIRSPIEDRNRGECNKRMSIEDSLSTIEDVITAKVVLNLPPKDPLSEAQGKATASVLLKTRYDAEIKNRMLIKKIVANSISGLNYKDVALIIDPTPSMLEHAPDLEAIANKRAQNVDPIQAGAANRVFLIGVAVLLFFTTIITVLYQRGRKERDSENANMLAYDNYHRAPDGTELEQSSANPREQNLGHRQLNDS